MNLRPAFDQIVLKDIKRSEKVGNLYRPQSYSSEGRECEVVAMGPGPYTKDGVTVSAPCVVGDKILIHTGAGFPYELPNGDEVRVISSLYVVCVMEE